MLLFDIGAMLFGIGLLILLCFLIFPPKYVKNFDDNQRMGCFGLLIILAMTGGIVMIVAHFCLLGLSSPI